MVVDWMFRVVFVVYCLTIGTLLLYAPWSTTWDTLVAHAPGGWQFLGQPFLRGGLSGFGLVHLVWVLNDLDELFHPEDRHGD